MARIAGVDIPKNKRVCIALTYIYGIGNTGAKSILEKAKVDGSTRTKDLTPDQIVSISKIIESEFKVEGDLRRDMQMSVKRLMELAAYRGLRHRRRLPVRGQRTKTNARTRKGKKGMAIAGKKAPGKK